MGDDSRISIEDSRLTHLLGYLTPDQWRDAIKHYHIDKAFCIKLMEVQERTYSFNLKDDVFEGGN